MSATILAFPAPARRQAALPIAPIDVGANEQALCKNAARKLGLNL